MPLQLLPVAEDSMKQTDYFQAGAAVVPCTESLVVPVSSMCSWAVWQSWHRLAAPSIDRRHGHATSD